MLLRCGECETFREVTVPNVVAERFDVELDRRAGLVCPRRPEARTSSGWPDQIETFVHALRRRLAASQADFAR